MIEGAIKEKGEMMTTEQKRMLIGIFLIAATMRAPLTATGVLTGIIRDEMALSSWQAGLITTVPLIVFFLTSPILPKWGERFGINRLLFLGMLAIVAGQLFRAVSGYCGFLVGTAIMALGISAANVLLPALLKLEYPSKVGVITSGYIPMMTFSAGISAGLTIPIMTYTHLGWREGLAIWSLLGLVAFFLWASLQKRKLIPKKKRQERDGLEKPLWQQSLVWHITFFMGLQSLIYYSLVSWLPEILASQGLARERISLYIFAFQMISIPAAFLAPILAEKVKDQRWIGFLSGFSYFLGLGLLLPVAGLQGISLPVVIVLLAIGSGATISLAMFFFNARTEDSLTAGELSGLAQSVGYLLAALGPISFGRLFDSTGSWVAVLVLLLTLAGVLSICGYLSGRDRYVQ